MVTDKQNGVSLIITFFIMIIILAVVLSVSALLYSEVKVIRNIGDSMVSLYAADSGIEKVLYYDRWVLPTLSDGKTQVKRGLCTMYMSSYDSVNNPDACAATGSLNPSVYCAPIKTSSVDFSSPVSLVTDHNGCDPAICDNCEISFSTAFDSRSYSTTAKVYPSADGKTSELEIESKGVFGTAGRQIQIFSGGVQYQQVGPIDIENDCANPESTPQGTTVTIEAYVSATVPSDTISSVAATIHDADGNTVTGGGNLPLAPIHGNYTSDVWEYIWKTTSTVTAQAYYVDLDAKDTLSSSDEVTEQDIPPCGF